jgi:UDP-glucose 4-epimerase
MSRCLVTGGAGFIGSNLVDELIYLGHEVIVLDNESAKNITEPHWNDKAINFKLDVGNYHNTKSIYKDVDYVFHLAASARMQPSIDNPTDCVENNIMTTSVVLQCAKEHNVKRVIYSSSSSIYGSNLIPNHELLPDKCLNPYSVSKLFGEKLCSVYNNIYNLKTISLRYFNVYGPRQPLRGQYAPVIGLFLKQKEDGKPLTVVGDGSQRRDFTHVSDIVYANILAAFTDIDSNSFGKIYNVGTGTNYSILEIAKMISDNIVFIEKRPGEANETKASVANMVETFGWIPQVNLKEWLTSV